MNWWLLCTEPFGAAAASICQESTCPVLSVTEINTDEIAGSHVGLHSSFSVFVSHFNAELVRCGRAVQEQPSGSALLLHAMQAGSGRDSCLQFNLRLCLGDLHFGTVSSLL